MEPVSALSASEEAAWRALTYVANHLVPVLSEDLAGSGVSLSEYVVLVHVSEAEDEVLRIGDLAAISGLSASRMSRLVDDMASKGWLEKSRHRDDARCTLAALAPAGLEVLKQTYPTQLANVRRRVFDHLSERETVVLATALSKVKMALESAQGRPVRPR